MSQTVKLLGLDCGSTTTSAVIATARVATSAMGRFELSQLEQTYRSEMVYTPLKGSTIDTARLSAYLSEWLAAAQVQPAEIFGGGALVTGLAAQSDNAAQITALVEERLADSIVATADDPCLESWLAFMGNSHSLSQDHPTTPILNLDIGGGTTNLALALNGQVLALGYLFLGARHFQFTAGTYQLTSISSYGRQVLDHLDIKRQIGEELQPGDVRAILDFYLGLLEAVIEGRALPAGEVIERQVQVPLRLADEASASLLGRAAITLSGGVGQLVYRVLAGETFEEVTPYGDLGLDLAKRLLASQRLAGRIGSLRPEGLGRATVFGLLKHSTELAGATCYIPRPQDLPLKNVPILGHFGPQASDGQLTDLLALAARSRGAAALQVDLTDQRAEPLRTVGMRLAERLESMPWPREVTLVLLVPANLGKVLGQLVTRWGTLDARVLVIDELPDRDAQFVRIGRPRESLVPAWLYAVR